MHEAKGAGTHKENDAAGPGVSGLASVAFLEVEHLPGGEESVCVCVCARVCVRVRVCVCVE